MVFASRPVRCALGLLLFVYLIFALRYLHRTSFVYEGERVFTLWDDAMISMRYARNCAQGNGLVWNVGERVQGFTNLGLTLLMVGLHLAPTSVNTTPLLFQLISVVWLLLIIYGTAELTARLVRSATAGLAGATVIALFTPLGIWGIQGADSAAMSLVLLSASLQAGVALENRTRRYRTFLVLALGLVIRLDFTIPASIFLAFLAVDPLVRKTTLLRGIGVSACVLGGIALLGVSYFGRSFRVKPV